MTPSIRSLSPLPQSHIAHSFYSTVCINLIPFGRVLLRLVLYCNIRPRFLAKGGVHLLFSTLWPGSRRAVPAWPGGCVIPANFMQRFVCIFQLIKSNLLCSSLCIFLSCFFSIFFQFALPFFSAAEGAQVEIKHAASSQPQSHLTYLGSPRLDWPKYLWALAGLNNGRMAKWPTDRMRLAP